VWGQHLLATEALLPESSGKGGVGTYEIGLGSGGDGGRPRSHMTTGRGSIGGWDREWVASACGVQHRQRQHEHITTAWQVSPD